MKSSEQRLIEMCTIDNKSILVRFAEAQTNFHHCPKEDNIIAAVVFLDVIKELLPLKLISKKLLATELVNIAGVLR